MGFPASWEKIYVSFLTKNNFFPQAHIFSPTWGSQQVGGKNINLFLTEIIIIFLPQAYIFSPTWDSREVWGFR